MEWNLVREACAECFSRVRFCATLWTVACQASLSMGISRQEYWSGLQFPSPEDLPNWGTEPESPALQVDSLPFKLQGTPPGIFLTQGLNLRLMSPALAGGFLPLAPPGKPKESIDESNSTKWLWTYDEYCILACIFSLCLKPTQTTYANNLT